MYLANHNKLYFSIISPLWIFFTKYYEILLLYLNSALFLLDMKADSTKLIYVHLVIFKYITFIPYIIHYMLQKVIAVFCFSSANNRYSYYYRKEIINNSYFMNLYMNNNEFLCFINLINQRQNMKFNLLHYIFLLDVPLISYKYLKLQPPFPETIIY